MLVTTSMVSAVQYSTAKECVKEKMEESGLIREIFKNLPVLLKILLLPFIFAYFWCASARWTALLCVILGIEPDWLEEPEE